MSEQTSEAPVTRQMHRLDTIPALLRQRPRTSTELAEELGVSWRTVLRDIRRLQAPPWCLNLWRDNKDNRWHLALPTGDPLDFALTALTMARADLEAWRAGRVSPDDDITVRVVLPVLNDAIQLLRLEREERDANKKRG